MFYGFGYGFAPVFSIRDTHGRLFRVNSHAPLFHFPTNFTPPNLIIRNKVEKWRKFFL